jgi:hypothetical protein
MILRRKVTRVSAACRIVPGEESRADPPGIASCQSTVWEYNNQPWPRRSIAGGCPTSRHFVAPAAAGRFPTCQVERWPWPHI